MYFRAKNTLKSNRYYTFKHPLKRERKKKQLKEYVILIFNSN
jgi:hypothetical protein